MRKFLRNLFFFGCLVFSVVLLLQCIISYRIKGKSLSGHDNLEETANINAQLIFLGSSRCWSHFNPRFFDSTYKIKSVNIGVSGHSELSMSIVRLKDYLSRNKPPKFAILSFDPFMYAGSENNNRNVVHKSEFARYTFFPKKKDLLMLNYFQFNFFEKYFPLYSVFKYGLMFSIIKLKPASNYMKYGYEFNTKEWDTVSNPVIQEINLKKIYFWKQKDIPLLMSSMIKLKAFCSEKNIKLMCIQTPVYRDLYDYNIFSQADSICKVLNIPFIDADQEYIRNDIKNFANANHLDATGVNKMNIFLENCPKLSTFLSQ